MSKWISNASFLTSIATALMMSGTSSAHHKQFKIECEHTIFPSCCTAIHESAGANANYSWTTNKGWLERRETSYPWNWHHCGIAVGKSDINTSIDKGVAYGHGKPICPLPGIGQ